MKDTNKEITAMVATNGYKPNLNLKNPNELQKVRILEEAVLFAKQNKIST